MTANKITILMKLTL